MPTIPLKDPGPELVEGPASMDFVCRCGTKVAHGRPSFRVVDSRWSIARMLDGVTFCSVGCLRAWFLECLEAFDQIDTEEGQSYVTDLRLAHAELAAVFASVVDSQS